jgi:hypothetical protein
MSFYISKTQNKVVKQFINGSTNYLFGFRDDDTIPFQFGVSNVSVASNVVTATGNIFSGGGGQDYLTLLPPVPVKGAVIGVNGINASNANIDPGVISNANIGLFTGSGTITFSAPNSGNANSIVSGGVILVQPFTYPDTLTANTASQQLATKFSPDTNDSSKTYLVQTTFPNSPVSCNVVIQVANDDLNYAYANVLNEQGTFVAAQVLGNVVTQSTAEYVFKTGKFIRAFVTDATSNANTTSTIVTNIFG